MGRIHLIGTNVTHKAFGSGIIRSQDVRRLEVYFEAKDKVCVFQYPEAFETFLTLEEGPLKEKVLSDLAFKKHLQESEKGKEKKIERD